MLHSRLELAQQVVQAAIEHGVKHVVISPGSRNAPLIIEWNAYSEIEKYSIVDERSAAFFALGKALQTGEAVALVCTSGSALLNYYPALAEAYYSDIPLLVLSADRPKRLIDIGDGQTIRQENVFQNHVWFNANLIEDDTLENIALLQEAFRIFKQKKAPIHINIPFSEPLYETTEHLISAVSIWQAPNASNRLLEEEPLEVDALQKFADIWNQSDRKMVLVGVSRPDEMLQIQLSHLAQDPSVVILTESTSNVSHERFINHIDRLIFPLTDSDFESLKPDIVLSIGGQVISKKIKSLLRKNKPKHHWHVDRNWALDTYHGMTQHFGISPQLFFSQFFFLTHPKASSYQSTLLEMDGQRTTRHDVFLKQAEFSDLKVYESIQKHLPEGRNVVFSNSASIRYAQFFDWSKAPFMACNRGTSGIDGSTSTAIGFAHSAVQPTLLVSGELSFFYDSNALWNAYIPNDFRIVVVNNGGGGIFRFIPGPTTTNTLDFFETPHQLTARHLCAMHQLEYTSVQNEKELAGIWSEFYKASSQPKLLEIFTPREINAVVLKGYFNAMK